MTVHRHTDVGTLTLIQLDVNGTKLASAKNNFDLHVNFIKIHLGHLQGRTLEIFLGFFTCHISGK